MYKRKKAPCEQCRYQKRRCNEKQPCERCEKLGLACIYVKNVGPDDEEFIQLVKENELKEQVAQLEDQLDDMATTMQTLKRQRTYSGDTPNTAASTPSLIEDTNSINSDDNSNASLSLCNHQVSTPSPSIWILEVTKGELRFRTQVKTHSDLLIHAQQLSSVIQLNDSVPYSIHGNQQLYLLLDFLNLRFTRKTIKNRYKGSLKAIEYLTSSKNNSDQPHESSIISLATSSPEATVMPILNTAISLVKAYIECQHLYHWAIFIPTFYQHFIQPSLSVTTFLSLEDDQQIVSPALYAFCAMICTMDCDHISKVIPKSLLSVYGHYYFEQARELVEDRFDDISMELLTTYVFIAVYQWNISCENRSIQYSGMAYRLAYLMMDQIEEEQKQGDIEQAIYFGRIMIYMERMCVFEKVQNSDRNQHLQRILERLRQKKDMVFNSPLSTPHLMENEHRFLYYHIYRRELQFLIQQTGRTYDRDSTGVMDMVAQISQRLEFKLKEWYGSLDDGYKLKKLPLFEGTSINDEVYYQCLEQECDTNVVPALMTLAIYEELIFLGFSFVPKSAVTWSDQWFVNLIEEIWKGGNEFDAAAAQKLEVDLDKWRRRIQKINKLKTEIGFEGSDKDYAVFIKNTLCSGPYRYGSPFLALVFDSALNVIRISRYLQLQRQRGINCYFDKRLVVYAKTILGRLLYMQDKYHPKVTQHVSLIHRYISICDDMLHD
ncbi:uncharacterized protein BX664DRAFT_323014 [Halteromyces radiatus]|uniref:uncharacterized protein n=1 Tax=Halteromyces radiatus TaxID=101107 RepID=UPI00221EA0B0|nr:uncharacterized protein BX664DRAFT_323014 [Halteromyces radiatus]KAI8100154.1 hypothetical protein BX664DRAFT_323014 [Halteromyces radiatus]